MIIEDKEFGEIIVRKSPLARGVRFSVSTSGRLQMSVPKFAKSFLIKGYINQFREQIRRDLPLEDPKEQRARDYRKKMLMKAAKAELPYRVEFFAKKYGYRYDNLRFSHANTRWGSCSSNRTISLNIGLMKSEICQELRDYVILHELAHLNHMDHSTAFWAEVGEHDPKYKIHRKRLKMFSPGV